MSITVNKTKSLKGYSIITWGVAPSIKYNVYIKPEGLK